MFAPFRGIELQDPESLKTEAVAEVDATSKKLIEISDRIHANPEVGHQEFATSKLLSDELEGAGFKVERKVCGLATAFKAAMSGKAGGPTVALLAEMDALAGIGHGCGHNIIGTASLGAALALRKIMPKINGNLVVYGTPAEEGGVENAGGKVIMASEIAKADVAMMVHPSNRTVVEATHIAREALEFEFFGKAAHAGGSPYEGVNALNAVIHFFTLVDSLRQHVKSDVRIHGIITEGGDATNVVPEHAVAKMYVRAAEKEYMKEVVGKVKKCAEGAAIATGTTMKVRNYANTLENTVSNQALAEAMKKNWEKIGVKVEQREREGGGGSSDIGNVSQVIPAIHPYIAIGPETMPSHSTEFVKAAASDQGHRALINAAKGLAMTSIDVFTNPELLGKIKQEFRKYKEEGKK